jgi:hypothetical protein
MRNKFLNQDLLDQVSAEAKFAARRRITIFTSKTTPATGC